MEDENHSMEEESHFSRKQAEEDLYIYLMRYQVTFSFIPELTVGKCVFFSSIPSNDYINRIRGQEINSPLQIIWCQLQKLR